MENIDDKAMEAIKFKHIEYINEMLEQGREDEIFSVPVPGKENRNINAEGKVVPASPPTVMGMTPCAKLVQLLIISHHIDVVNKGMRNVIEHGIATMGEQRAYAEFMSLRHQLASLESRANTIFILLNGYGSVFSNQPPVQV